MNHYYLAEGTKRNNLGDIIQGMSARTFLNENAICLDREKLDEFNGEAGILIANGWFMHDYKAFPPSSKLTPFYISFHLASIKLLFSKANRNHFKKFGPVGCRDRKTQFLFLLNGIPAFYSGCLTITFNKKNSNFKRINTDSLVMIDNVDHKFPKEIKEKIGKISGKEIRFLNHDPIQDDTDYDDYLNSNESYINKLIEEYLGASLVITNKLHCALPCLSLGIKVIFIHPNPKDGRLNILGKFIPIYSYSEVLNWDKIPDFKVNQNVMKQTRYKLERLTISFVEKKINPFIKSSNLSDNLELFFIKLVATLLNGFGYIIRKYKSSER
jgi:hypothetical protein